MRDGDSLIKARYASTILRIAQGADRQTAARLVWGIARDLPLQASVQRLPVSTSPPSTRLLNWQLLFRIQLISNDRVFGQTPQMRLAAGFTLLKAEARFDALKSNRCTH